MANTRIQFKRTTVSGRLPNTTNSSNTTYIAAGEFAINLADGKVVSSNGSVTFEVGANLSSLNVGSTIAVGTATINSTIFSATANNANNLNGQVASYYTNATNITTGTLPAAQLPSNVVFWSNTNTFSNTQIFNATVTHAANLTMNTAASVLQLGNSTVAVAISANGSNGSSGQVLSSNGTSVYWAPSTSATLVKQQFTGDGSNTQFAVTGGYSAGALTVYVNGVKQLETIDVVTTSGANIAFNYAPPSGSQIEVFGYINVAINASYLLLTGGSLTGGINVGTNVAISLSNITVGNSTVNSFINATTLSTGNTVIGASSISVGNSTFNTSINATSIVLGNSTVNTSINATSIVLGNSTSNIVISVPNTTQVSNGSYFLNANGSYTPVISGGDSTVNTLTYSASLSLDSNVSTTYYVAATGNPTISITGGPSAGSIRNVTLIFNHSGGVRSITWGGSNIKFTDNTAPVLSNTSGGTDVLTFFTYDQGSNWYGSLGWWSNT